MKSSQWIALLIPLFFAGPAHAGKNAGGALVVHTNDAYSYSTGTACTTEYAVPTSCEGAITRSDKSEGAVLWLLAAFDSTATPAVTVIYFGIDYDDVNLDPGSAYKFCGPPGTLEVPDDDWPYTGRGNSLAFGSAVAGHILFPFYVFRIDGGTEGSYFSTAVNPTGGYAAFVDDSNPPTVDQVTRFGTLSWFESGSNSCPELSEGDGGDHADQDHNEDQGIESNEGVAWVSNRVIIRLRPDLPLPSRLPVGSLGVPSVDALCRQIGLRSARRLIGLRDEAAARYPVTSRYVILDFLSDINERSVAQSLMALPEVRRRPESC